MSEKSAKEILEENMPDVDIVETPSTTTSNATRQATTPGPSLMDLRKKYLGSDAELEEAADVVEVAAANEEDVEVKQVRLKETPADPADDPGLRAVIISKVRGILGSQG